MSRRGSGEATYTSAPSPQFMLYCAGRMLFAGSFLCYFTRRATLLTGRRTLAGSPRSIQLHVSQLRTRDGVVGYGISERAEYERSRRREKNPLVQRRWRGAPCPRRKACERQDICMCHGGNPGKLDVSMKEESNWNAKKSKRKDQLRKGRQGQAAALFS